MNLPVAFVIAAAGLIVGGRVGRRWLIAIAGYIVLAAAALLVVLGAGTRN